ncbi:MAG: methionyl-tRNA formyltransferase, partial [Patescibacteria group bacterium]
MKKIKLAYFGSPDFAADFLEKILLDKSLPVEVKLVVTQPDSPVGRKKILTPTPVKIIALKHNLKVLEIGNFLGKLDLVLVYAYGDLIPKELLTLPRNGFWNIHPSLLPKYRGTSPIATPLINGDKITGVTIIKMDEEIDHGPIIAQENLT